MSQLVSFTELPFKAVQSLVPRALVQKSLFRKPVSRLEEYLDQHGTDLGGFDADGFYIVLVLMYLREFCRVNLLDGNRGLALMAHSLTKYHGSFFTFFTADDREHHVTIRAGFEPSKLQQLCDRNEVEYALYSHSGTLKAAAHRIADVLAQLKDEHVVLVSVG